MSFPLTKTHSKWEDDSLVSNCNICKSKFNPGYFKSGKHHCRKCGRIVCADCSKYKYLKHRICYDCNVDLNSSETKKEQKTMEYEQNESGKTELITIQEMDRRLAAYYQELGVMDYYQTDQQNIGKLEQWCNENDFNAEQIKEEFDEADVEDCVIVEFDPNFPLKHTIDDEQERLQQIFKILNNIYKTKGELYIKDFQLNFNDIEDAMVETYKIYKNNMKTFTHLADINMLYFRTISTINGNHNNLLLNIIDCYKRDSLENILKNASLSDYNQSTDVEQKRVSKWISKLSFLKQLTEKLKTIKLNTKKIELGIDEKSTYENNHKQFELDLATIIRVYPLRIGPRLNIPHNSRLIDDDLEIIAKYMVSSAGFIDHHIMHKHKYKIGSAPCLIDFILLLPPTISNMKVKAIDPETGDFIDDYKQNCDKDIIGDVIQHLTETACKMNVDTISGKNDTLKNIERKINQSHRALQKQLNIKDDSYPRNRRLNVIIDRRNIKDDNDVLIMFEPPSDCNTIPQQHLAEKYFDLSRMCLIPKSDNQEVIDSTTVAQGQILTLSYHVWSSDEIKCYLYWQGESHRFYPQDIIGILTNIFNMNQKNKNFITSDRAKRFINRMQISDKKFEMFYRGLHGLQQHNFPKKY